MSEGRSKRRTKEEIAYAIISSAMDGQKKTKIMYEAGMNLFQLDSYLEDLIGKGMLTLGSRRIYLATEKGKNFLTAFEQYMEARGVLDGHKAIIDSYLHGTMERKVEPQTIEQMARQQ